MKARKMREITAPLRTMRFELDDISLLENCASASRNFVTESAALASPMTVTSYSQIVFSTPLKPEHVALARSEGVTERRVSASIHEDPRSYVADSTTPKQTSARFLNDDVHYVGVFGVNSLTLKISL